ncbi:MAG: PAS domain-containing protein, partial [Blastopirellula sp. JB062]
MDAASLEEQIVQLRQKLREVEADRDRLHDQNNELISQLASLRGLADNLPCFLFQTLNKTDGSDFKMPFVGDGIRRFGYTPEEVYQRPELMVEMIHPEDRDRYFSEVRECFNNEKLQFAIEMRIISPRGE